VPAAIARAEAELADGRRVGFETTRGPGYRGRNAGKVRFFLAALPLTDPSDDESGGLVAVRFFDASGALVGIVAADCPRSASGSAAGAPGRSARGRWPARKVRASLRRRAAAARRGVAQRDAEADRLCAGIDRLLADGSDCALPPLTADDAYALGEGGLLPGR
jgi:hypothetical protein